MDLNYCKDKPGILQTMWEIMENVNEKYPHLRFGWDGFVLIIIE